MKVLHDKETKLVESATEIFMKFGIKSVNMDDMSRHLGISKKTLYHYVKDKEDLVQKSVNHFCNKEDEEIRHICSRGMNAVDESLDIMRWVLSVLKQVHPSVNYDLEKYHPATARSMKENRHRAVYDCMRMNMKKGQREGYYRKDFKADVIAKLYIVRIDIIFDQTLFPMEEHNLGELYKEIFKYHIRGIASEKGLNYLKEKLKSSK